jgi:hypothetical protein
VLAMLDDLVGSVMQDHGVVTGLVGLAWFAHGWFGGPGLRPGNRMLGSRPSCHTTARAGMD